MIFRNRNRIQSLDLPPPPVVPIMPDQPFFAVGDVHGCDRLLERLLKRLDSVAHPEALLVLTGDYIDRGEDTARVLRRLRVLSEAAGDLMHCIMGNHEQMLLDVIENPVEFGPRWLRHGGLQTLASYRIQPPAPSGGIKANWIGVRDQLAAAIGEPTLNWLRDLPLSWQSGNVVVVHAGADPALPIDSQDMSSLLWGHPDFRRRARSDGLWIVHGHTIVDTPQALNGRISTDTGAYATGILTAALIETEQVSFYAA
jgi:serine/threonine protein phosphatase 1